VTITGPSTATPAATAHTEAITTETGLSNSIRPGTRRAPTQNDSTANVATVPQIHITNKAMGMCCCSLPETMSGESRLIAPTADQMPPRAIAMLSNALLRST
jgi:hypothetical protein